MSDQFRETLAVLLRARLPALYVETAEEERLVREIRAVADDSAAIDGTREVVTWTVTDGLRLASGQPIEQSSDIGFALEYARQTTTPTVFVFCDLPAHFGSGNHLGDPAVVRRTRDAIAGFRATAARNTLVLVSPALQLPPELEKDVHVVEFPLPDKAEVDAILTAIAEADGVGHSSNMDLGAGGRETLINAALGLTAQEAADAFARALAADGRLDPADLKEVVKAKRDAARRSGVLEFVAAPSRLEDVGGLENLKRWLAQRSGSWLAAAAAYGITAPKGVLITGVPGCGKSLTAKAVATSWGLPLLRMDVGRIFSGLIGSSERNMRNAIKAAEAAAPCVLWIDEIEKGFGGIGGTAQELDAGTSSRVFGTFLTWMQEKTTPVFVIATANNVRALPPEFLRKGRFDETFFVDLPDPVERAAIWHIHLKRQLGNAPAHRDFKPTENLVAELTRDSEGFSGAEIEQAIITAFFDAYGDRRPLNANDLGAALQRTVPLSISQREQLDAARKWAANRSLPANDRR